MKPSVAPACSKKKIRRDSGIKHDPVNPAEKHSSPETKYEPAIAEQVKLMVIELGCVNQRGEIAWGRIARLIGVSVETLRNWRTKSSPYYHEEFAGSVNEAVASVDTGAIKRGLIEAAKPHAVVKRVRVMKAVGPQPPPKSWTKTETLAFARLKLGLDLDEELSKVEIRLIIEAECEKRSKEKMVTVREERTREQDIGAAKFVLPNYGPPAERWSVKEQRTHDVTDEFAELLKEIGSEPVGLPGQKMDDG